MPDMPDICRFLAIPDKINMDTLGFVYKWFIQWKYGRQKLYDDHDHDYLDDGKIYDDGDDDENNGDNDDDDNDVD